MSAGPLAGVRVLDAATLLAAPTAATLLSEYGAEVVKIEQPGVGDTIRTFSPFREDVSLLWKVIGRNRESVTLNLREERGRDVLRRLAAECEVVILNYRPETVEKWGLGFDDLVRCRPDIVVLHLTAFGATGPYAQRPGFARVAESFTGLADRTGYPDRPPVLSGYPMLGDGIAGLYGAFAILLALRERDRTGEPQFIDLGLYEPLLRLIEDQVAGYDEDGTVMERYGNANPAISPNGMFPTRDGRHVAIPASTNPIFRRLVGLIGDESLLVYDDNRTRVAHRVELERRVEEWTRSLDLAEIVELCAGAGIACGPVYSAAEIATDPHVAARESLVRVEDPETGRSIRMAAPAGRFSGFTGRIRSTGPALGSGTDAVLRSVLEMSEEEIGGLRADGVI